LVLRSNDFIQEEKGLFRSLSVISICELEYKNNDALKIAISQKKIMRRTEYRSAARNYFQRKVQFEICGPIINKINSVTFLILEIFSKNLNIKI